MYRIFIGSFITQSIIESMIDYGTPDPLYICIINLAKTDSFSVVTLLSRVFHHIFITDAFGCLYI